MRIVQRPGYPLSIVLVAEDEREAVLVAALREHPSSLQVHRMLSDENLDEFVRRPAQEVLDREHVALEMLGGAEDLRQQECVQHRSWGQPHRLRRDCPQCQMLLESDQLGRVVELEVTVPCACWDGCEESTSYDGQTGHVRECLVPRAKALGMEVEDGRANAPLSQVRR